jgi:hypothetical protein
MAERAPWSERRKTADRQLSSAEEFDTRTLGRTPVQQIGVWDAQVVTKKRLATLLPSRRGLRGSPSLQLSNTDRFQNVPIVSGMIR